MGRVLGARSSQQEDPFSEEPPGREEESSGGGDSRRRPIGVPSGYRAEAVRPESFIGMSAQAAEGWASQGYGPLDRRSIAPKYFEGSQFQPANLTPAGIAGLQRDLMLVGLLDPGEVIQFGRWQGGSVSAFEKLLEYANSKGMTWQQAIQELGAGNTPSAPGVDAITAAQQTAREIELASLPPLHIQLSNPDELREAFRAVSTDELGVGRPRAELDRMVQAYQQVERQTQQEAYMAGLEGGTTLTIPSPETYAHERLIEEQPEEVELNSGMELLMNLIGEWGQ